MPSSMSVALRRRAPRLHQRAVHHPWLAGRDIYFACFWAKASGQTCRDSVRAFSQDPEGGWEAVVKRMPAKPDNLHYRAVRHAIVASYQHWDRPITLDATLKRQLKR
jgi:hypothetical protein